MERSKTTVKNKIGEEKSKSLSEPWSQSSQMNQAQYVSGKDKHLAHQNFPCS